jgi:hypothetical protein
LRFGLLRLSKLRQPQVKDGSQNPENHFKTDHEENIKNGSPKRETVIKNTVQGSGKREFTVALRSAAAE